MNPKNTWTLVALAAALFAFIFFFERHLDRNSDAEKKSHQLLADFRASAVSRIEIKDDRRSLVADRTNDVWQLTSPVGYPASQGRIAAMLQVCEKLAWTSAIGPRELAEQPRGLADFGLQPPQATLIFTQDKQRYELRVGAKTPVAGQLYVQLDGRNEVYLVDGALFDKLPANVDDWRDRSLLELHNLAFNRIEVRSGPRGFEFERGTNNIWRMTKPLLCRADNAKIGYLVSQLELWPIKRFVSDDPQVDLDRYGLHPPDLELIFGQNTNDVLAAQFGRNPTNDPGAIYVRRLSHTNLVTAPREWLDMLRAPYTDFRDRRLLSLTRVTNIDRIDIRGVEKIALQHQTNGSWLALDATNYPVDAKLVNEFMLNLAELEIVNFEKDVPTDYSPYGLTNPILEYSLLRAATNADNTPTNQIAAQVSFGGSQGGAVYARRADEDAVYTVSEISLQRLPQSLYQFRDRSIWNLNATNISSITVQQGGKVRKLTRNAKSVWTLAPGSQGMIDPLSVEDALRNLCQLRAEKWIGRGPADVARFIPPELAHEVTLEIVTDGKPVAYTVAFGRMAPSRGPYAVTDIDGQQVVFLAAESLYADILRDLTINSPGKAR